MPTMSFAKYSLAVAVARLVASLTRGRRSKTRIMQPHPSLPQELVDMIISYLMYDTRTLLACTMTCFSWYIAAVPHLHYSLTTYRQAGYIDLRHEKYHWPRPLKKSYKLGLFPFVNRLSIRWTEFEFNAKWFDKTTFRYFSALTNLRVLRINKLQVSGFMPRIRQYFGHFAPALQDLCLIEPCGTYRQILYFIGLFPKLQNLRLSYLRFVTEHESSAEQLIPLSAPPLCGTLVFKRYNGEALVKGMIEFFGGLRFRYVNILQVDCTGLVLEACAETLEKLRLCPSETVDPLRPDFDLSKHASLRTLEIEAKSTAHPGTSSFLKTVLSTITSALPPDLVIIHNEFEVGSPFWGPRVMDYSSADERAKFFRRCRERFRMLREIYSVREFRLVLCAEVFGCAEKHAVDALKHILEDEGKDGGLDYLRHKPSVISIVGRVRWAGVQRVPDYDLIDKV